MFFIFRRMQNAVNIIKNILFTNGGIFILLLEHLKGGIGGIGNVFSAIAALLSSLPSVSRNNTVGNIGLLILTLIR